MADLWDDLRRRPGWYLDDVEGTTLRATLCQHCHMSRPCPDHGLEYDSKCSFCRINNTQTTPATAYAAEMGRSATTVETPELRELRRVAAAAERTAASLSAIRWALLLIGLMVALDTAALFLGWITIKPLR